ncbi:MAG: NAD(P)H-hydrate dehydratase [Sarcina sp.]
MRLYNANQVKKIDSYCIEKLSIPSMVLMENAAVATLKHLDLHINNKFIIICGVGNNGGDGLAIARHLIVRCKDVQIFIIGNLEKQTINFSKNKNILENMNIDITLIEDENSLILLKEAIIKSDLIIDAIFGIGLKREIKGLFKSSIEIINEYSKNTIGIDIPSGINADTGKIMGISTFCNKTVTFSCYKKSMMNYREINNFGEIFIETIGIPNYVMKKFHEKLFLVDFEDIKLLIPVRGLKGHKGSYGKVLVVAGSNGFSGAAYISSNSAVKSGSGLVTLCTDSLTQKIVSSKAVEFMTCDYHEYRFKKLLSTYDCVAIGMGLGDSESTLSILKDVILNHEKVIIIDADGINVLRDNKDLLNKTKAKIIITPHVGEMARLLNCEIPYINENRIQCAKMLAKDFNIIVLLKGHNTVITDGEYVYINPTGNSAMASGGMGDCLTGIILSLVGQGIKPIDACIAGAYIHGYIAQELSKDLYTVQASDIMENISRFMNKFK